MGAGLGQTPVKRTHFPRRDPGRRVEWKDTVLPDSAEAISLRSGSPRAIDFGSGHNRRECVYHVNGDVLTIVYPKQGGQRPSSLERGDTKAVLRRKR